MRINFKQEELIQNLLHDIKRVFPTVELVDITHSPEDSDSLWINVTAPENEDEEIELRSFASEITTDILVDYGYHMLVMPIYGKQSADARAIKYAQCSGITIRTTWNKTMKNHANPFANKGRIVTGKDFIGRFNGLKTIASTVTDLPGPNNLAIIGYPRTGKSSLAHQAIIQKKECLLENRKVAIWVDFSSFSSREAFFKHLVRYSYSTLKRTNNTNSGISDAAAEVLEKEKTWDNLKYDVEQYFETVRTAGWFTIFVLDEFDEARNKFENNPEAFRQLRNLGYRPDDYGVAFVTTSRRSIREIEIQSKVSSTLDGIFGKEYVAMYSAAELQDYYQLYTAINCPLDDYQKQRIEYYCGGHPHLLAVLGFEIVEQFRESSVVDVDALFSRVYLQFVDYYEQLVALLKEDQTFNNLVKILFGPQVALNRGGILDLEVFGLIQKGAMYYAAFSQHFQNYLKFKVDAEPKEGAWKLISTVEKGLRQFILKTLIDRYGAPWEANYASTYTHIPEKYRRLTEILETLHASRQKDIEQYGSLALNLTLLDETYIHQLFDYFILFSWDDVFRPFFGKERRYWNDVKKCLEKVRNPMAHHKTEVLLDSEIRRSMEYCEELLTIIQKQN